VQRYCHVGTGNYNPRTARLYEDIGILSSNEDLCDDLSRLFNQLSGFVKDEKFARLIVAPYGMRSGLLSKIQREILAAKAGKKSGIKFKLNSLVDEEFIEHLYEASISGDRDICAWNLFSSPWNPRQIREHTGEIIPW
jgi:polyphosphate kinase